MADFVTFDDLLEDPEPVTITVKRKNNNGDLVDAELRFYPRRPTDIEKGLAMGAANGARRTLRADLSDEKSERRALLVREALEDQDEAGLRQLWINGNLMERAAQLHLNSLEEREYIPEPEGDIVSAADRDAYDTAVSQAEDDRMKHLVEALQSIRAELEREAEVIPRESLLAAAIPAHIETLCAQEWNNVYSAQLISRCTFNDAKHTKPSFKTAQQVERLRSQNPRVYEELANTHRALLLDMEPGLGFSLGRRDS